MFKYNKGEWSEIYTFLKCLCDENFKVKDSSLENIITNYEILELYKKDYLNENELVFCPNTSWYRLKPWTLCIVFFAMSAQSRVVPQSHLLSLLKFNSVSMSVWLWRSSKPLHQGLWPAVAFISILKFSAMSCISSLLNSPPSSLKSRSGGPWTLIHE